MEGKNAGKKKKERENGYASEEVERLRTKGRCRAE
jgi:hypothetical protein